MSEMRRLEREDGETIAYLRRDGKSAGVLWLGGFHSDMLGTKAEAYTLDQLRALLVERGFAKDTAEAIVKELENCDFARFAPSASGPGEMKAAARRVRTLLGFIEREKLAGDKEAA